MASIPSKLFQALIPLLFTLLITPARPEPLRVDPSDQDAIVAVRKALSGSDFLFLESPCNSAGIFCEPRSGNKSTVLKITRIVLESRQLGGYLSPAIGRLSELRELSLPDNRLAGRIPYQIVGCRKLEILSLRNNRFSSNLPVEFWKLARLRVLDLSSNKLSGNLNFLKHFPRLEKLSLSDNLFSGEIPASVTTSPNLRFFNFSGNDLLNDSVLEISPQLFPKRYIYAENTTGRSNSTGTNQPPSAKGSNSTSDAASAPSPAPTRKPKNHRRKVLGWALGFFGGVIAGVICGMIFSVIFKTVARWIKGGGKDSSGLTIFSPMMIKKAEELAFLQKEEGLQSLEIIGKGGSGEVYKAQLSNGTAIAIKKVIQPAKEAAELADEDTKNLHKKMRQIKSEIETVGKIRHRNLLPLLAHVSRPDCHYLVYEYMKNGSLQDIIQEVRDGKRELDWLSRHRIAVGIVAGLEYLHSNHTERIIHRDLKPANILLDDDMEARISDFGLAKAMPEMKTHVTTTNVAGTVGYIAPEYHQTLKFTDKCDIYSFGVVLGVLVMGKLPSDQFFQDTDEMSMVKWMRNVLATSEDPKIAIDPTLLGNGYEEQMLLVLKIACFCTVENPKERPNSKDVRLMLSQITHE